MPKLESILSDYCGKLPQLTGESSYFPTFLFDHFKEYKKSIHEAENFLESPYNNGFVSEREDIFLKQLDCVSDGIKNAIEAYLKGLPSVAYNIFKETVDKTYLKLALRTSQIKHIKRDNNFYRVRMGDIAGPILPAELFHIPLEKRKFVTTQRFSIPGYPCLYMGNSLSVSFKETDIFTDDNLAKSKVARITNNSNILIVDIDPYQFPKSIYKSILGNNAKKANDIYQAGLLYPLIAACHCKLTYAMPVKFKIEYIVPQLLLQWFKEVTDNSLIQGIRYLSSRIDIGDIQDKMYNYVFPVVDCQKESGHCNNLRHLFKVSDVVDVSSFVFKHHLISEKVNELEDKLNGLPLNIL
jgi:hypothetical protein